MIGSMEDSFTNIFKLAELNELNWKRFSSSNPLPCMPADDYILSAYAKCMREGILCTWRRLIETQSKRDSDDSRIDSNSTEHKKELWCFWWGEKPKILETFEQLEGSEEWKWGEMSQDGDGPTGLDYQARSLLFKELVKLIFITRPGLCHINYVRQTFDQ